MHCQRYHHLEMKPKKYLNIFKKYLNKLDSTMYVFLDDDADSQADTEENTEV